MIINIGQWYLANEVVYSQNDVAALKAQIELLTEETTVTSEYEEPLYTDETLSITDIYNIAKEYSDVVYMSDSEYKCPEMGSICSFLEVNSVSEEAYVSEAHDCENYATELLGDVLYHFGNIPFGMVSIKNTETNSGHRLNCAYIEGQWYWVEPQTDELYTELDEKYEVVFITI